MNVRRSEVRKLLEYRDVSLQNYYDMILSEKLEIFDLPFAVRSQYSSLYAVAFRTKKYNKNEYIKIMKLMIKDMEKILLKDGLGSFVFCFRYAIDTSMYSEEKEFDDAREIFQKEILPKLSK